LRAKAPLRRRVSTVIFPSSLSVTSIRESRSFTALQVQKRFFNFPLRNKARPDFFSFNIHQVSFPPRPFHPFFFPILKTLPPSCDRLFPLILFVLTTRFRFLSSYSTSGCILRLPDILTPFSPTLPPPLIVLHSFFLRPPCKKALIFFYLC